MSLNISNKTNYNGAIAYQRVLVTVKSKLQFKKVKDSGVILEFMISKVFVLVLYYYCIFANNCTQYSRIPHLCIYGETTKTPLLLEATL